MKGNKKVNNMKDLIIGLIIGMLVMGPAVHAVNITMENVTVKDMYRGFALCGILCSSQPETKRAAELASLYGDALYDRRSK